LIVGGGSKKQNMKTLKKFVALMTLAALVAGPAQALAQATPTNPDETTITTGFTVKTAGDVELTEVPVIKAVWETPDDYTTSAETQMDAPADCGQQKRGYYLRGFGRQFVNRSDDCGSSQCGF